MTTANRSGLGRSQAFFSHAAIDGPESRRRLRRLLILLSLVPALAGCLNREPAPTSTTVVYGDHTTVANCFLVRTRALATAIVNEPGREQSITMTVAPALPNAYRVIFTDLPDDKVKVAGYTIGTNPVAFYWFSVIRPNIRACAGQLDVR